MTVMCQSPARGEESILFLSDGPRHVTTRRGIAQQSWGLSVCDDIYSTEASAPVILIHSPSPTITHTMRTAFALKWSVLLALAAPALAQSQSVVATEVTSATDVVVSDAPVDSSTDTGAGSTPTVANLTPTASPATETGSAGGMNGTTGGTNGTAGGLGSSLK